MNRYTISATALLSGVLLTSYFASPVFAQGPFEPRNSIEKLQQADEIEQEEDDDDDGPYCTSGLLIADSEWGPVHLRRSDEPLQPCINAIIFGGDLIANLPTTITYQGDSPDDLNSGLGLDVWGGINTPIRGVQAFAKIDYGALGFHDGPAETISTTAFTVNGQYTAALTKEFGVFANGGVGLMEVHEGYTGGGDGWGPGFNVAIGGYYNVAPGVAVQAQLGYEGSLGAISMSKDMPVTVGGASVKVGVVVNPDWFMNPNAGMAPSSAPRKW